MNFSASNLISQAFELWKKHIVFSWMILGVIAAVSIVFGIITPQGGSSIISLISSLVSLFVELGAISLLFKLIRTGQEGDIKEIISQKEIYPQALLGSIIYYIMMVIGFILLVIPGIYVAVRFAVLPYVFVDQKLGWKEALNEASRLSEGNRMNIFGFILLLAVMNILGALCLLVGLLVSIPVSMIATTMLYEYLKKEKSGVTTEEVKVEEKKEEVIDMPTPTPEPVA
jgi:hypothetical protein